MIKTDSVEIIDHNIASPQLGSLHVVRFRPAEFTVRNMVIANSLGGHILTPDGFGLPYMLAQDGIDTLYVEFPGSGTSTLPESLALRADYAKKGAAAVGETVATTLIEEKETLEFDFNDLTVGGFSLGAVRGATMLPTFGSLVTTFLSADAAGYGSNANYTNLKRYRKHIGRSKEEMKKAGETVEGYFEPAKKVMEHYRVVYGYGINERKNSRYTRDLAHQIKRGLELRGIYDSMGDAILKHVKQAMLDACKKGEPYELRAGFAGNTYALDAVVVQQANTQFAEIEKAAADSGADVGIGIIQGSWFGEWHDQASSPARIKRLLTEPRDTLEQQLHPLYMA